MNAIVATPATRSRAAVPIVPIAEARLPLAARTEAFALLRARFADVAQRAPAAGDAARWVEHALGGEVRRFAQPLTFTPYAAAQACSARCRFCSETLIDSEAPAGMAAALRPGPAYFDMLARALRALRGLPLSYSLSGLESTDDPAWLLRLLATLAAAGAQGPRVEDRVLYSNGAGLARDGARLLPALRDAGLSWLEWSRHHDDAAANQAIMRFRAGETIAAQDVFERTLRAAGAQLAVKLVCIVQQGGIATVDDVLRYLRWARGLGVRSVIFREFSMLPASYRANATRRYIDAARVPMDGLLAACLQDARFMRTHAPRLLTGGYYFWNARFAAPDGGEVVFETSDYGAMHAHEADGAVHKLVFHANGNLCGGWHPKQHVLWRGIDARR